MFITDNTSSTMSKVAISLLLVGWCNTSVHSQDSKDDALLRQRHAALDYLSTLEARRDQRADIADLCAYHEQSTKGSTDAIFRFVRDSTHLVPYRGSLRGSRGVLSDRRGNSLDRAILLAELLRRSGRSVELASTTLTIQQARVLHRSLSAMDSVQLAREQAARVRQFLRYVRTQAGSPAHTLSNLGTSQATAERLWEVKARAERQAKELQRLIGAPRGQATNVADEHVRSLREHWWVLVKDKEELRQLDPTGLQEELELVANRRLSIDLSAEADASLPAEFLHSLEIRVVVEQWRDGQYHRHLALSHDFVPAQAIDKSIVLHHLPTKWSDQLTAPTAQVSVLECLKRQSEWKPVLSIGDQTISGKTFNTEGELLGDATDSPVGQLSGGLLGALQPKGMLTGVWLEYEIRRPNLPARIERRFLYDGAAGKRPSQQPESSTLEAAKRSLAMSDFVEILPMIGYLDPVSAQHRVLESLLSNRQFLQFSSAGKGAELDLPALAPEQALKPVAPHAALFGLYRSVLLNQFACSFIGEPNVIAVHRRIEETDQGVAARVLGVDIVSNCLDSFAPDREAFAASINSGVIDTNLEATFFDDLGSSGNTARLFRESASRDIEWQVLHNEQQLAHAGFPSSISDRMLASLSAGFAVVVSRGPVVVDGLPRVAWWRVNMQTGETLGIGNRGWGQSMIQKVAIEPTYHHHVTYFEYAAVASLVFRREIADKVSEIFFSWDPKLGNELSEVFRDLGLMGESIKETQSRKPIQDLDRVNDK